MRHPDILRRVEFYAQDIRAFEELGWEVVVATRARELVFADVYFVWWWTWAFVPLSLALIRRRPCVITGVFDAWAYPARPWLQRVVMRIALRYSALNIFVSQMELQDVPRMVVVSRPRYIPLGVDTKAYSAANTPRAGALVMAVAWLENGNAERKGIDTLIEAAPAIAARVQGATFIIAGEHGTAYARLAARVSELGLEGIVQFPGILSRDEKVRLMQQCTVYVQPSRFEGFGLAVLEALSCGAPVVCTSAGALGEVVGDAAITVSAGSPNELADAVVRLMTDSDLREALSRAAYQRARSVFDISRRIAGIASVLRELQLDDVAAREIAGTSHSRPTIG